MSNVKTLKQTRLLEGVKDYTPEEILRELRGRPWRAGPYGKQNWGIWLHSIAPYVGRIKPAFAHWLIRICTRPKDTVLDPFCGIGTIPLEADLLGRRAIGLELNPYALVVSKAKFDRRPLNEEIQWLKDLRLDLDSVKLEEISPYIRQFYHEQTLKEMFALKNEIIREHKIFLLGCLLGIAHGHRPQHLSAYTGYIVPYRKAKVPPKRYRAVIPRMIRKVRRMYTNPFPLKTEGEIIESDARAMPFKDESIDTVISSPPYYSTIDYVESNRLRLAILGFDDKMQEDLKEDLIQKDKTYLNEMKKVGQEIYRILKPESYCILVLGDVPKSKTSINTAEKVSELFSELGFETYGIIEDEIPTAKRTVLKWSGEEALKSMKTKLDRIVVMKVNK